MSDCLERYGCIFLSKLLPCDRHDSAPAPFLRQLHRHTCAARLLPVSFLLLSTQSWVLYQDVVSMRWSMFFCEITKRSKGRVTFCFGRDASKVIGAAMTRRQDRSQLSSEFSWIVEVTFFLPSSFFPFAFFFPPPPSSFKLFYLRSALITYSNRGVVQPSPFTYIFASRVQPRWFTNAMPVFVECTSYYALLP